MLNASPARRFAIVALAVSVGALFAVSCGGDDGDGGTPTEPEPSVASVSVTPQEETIALGQTAEFSASAEDSDGNSVSADFTWSSTNTSVASVDDQGVATGEADGMAEIVAEAEGVADSAAVTVTSESAASIAQVSGDGQYGVTNQTYGEPLVVEATDESGDPVEGAPIDWTVASGDASLSSGTTVTDADGRAEVEVTGGTSTGAITVEASHDGADGSPVSFGLETSKYLFLVGDNFFEDTEGRSNTSASAEVALGDTLRWEWIGNNQHNVESGEGQGGDSGDGVPDGGASMSSATQSDGSFEFVPDVEGTWEFYCVVHPNQMYGSTFTVTGGSSSSVTVADGGAAELEPGDVVRPEGSHFVFVYQGEEGEDR